MIPLCSDGNIKWIPFQLHNPIDMLLRNHYTREEFEKKLEIFSFKPSIIVNSGYGVHLYFLLDKPVEQKNGAEIERINEWIGEIEIKEERKEDKYNGWFRIGFAFANEFGEGGRDFFHRVSKVSPKYNKKDCDDQYDKCLKSNGEGITIATFFHYAKEAGLEIPIPNTSLSTTHPYFVDAGCLYRKKRIKEGFVDVKLSNFVAEIRDRIH